MKGLLLMLGGMALLSSCLKPASIFSNDYVKVQVRLVDAPHDKVRSVFVNVDEIRMTVSKEGKEKTLLIGKNVGEVDLLTLRDGKFLKVSELLLESDLEVKDIRLHLRTFGNQVVRKDGSRCELMNKNLDPKGLSVSVPSPLVLQAGHDYTLAIDFDAMKSVILKPNGECFLDSQMRLMPVKRSFAQLQFDLPESGDSLLQVENEDDHQSSGDEGLIDQRVSRSVLGQN